MRKRVTSPFGWFPERDERSVDSDLFRISLISDDSHSLEGGAAAAAETNSMDSGSTNASVAGAASGPKASLLAVDCGTMKYASIRSRPSSNRISAAELEEIIASQVPAL